ncbi:MAG: type II toxin-antitoxin system RelB/DinJ family antitoxin [Candidatus Peregrinibacteria bacterium]|nr:type II toxin-antitoxin system RelB/DinJ family antitoxin [Candidatus Peregrinibacteria bacterium]
MATVQIRIDEKTKKSAKKILDEVGLDMSSAIKLYFNQITIRQGIPFQILTENGLTLDQEKQIQKASAESKKGVNVTKSMNAKDALAYLKNLA